MDRYVGIDAHKESRTVRDRNAVLPGEHFQVRA